MTLDKKLARSLLPLVNSDNFDLLVDYVNIRIEKYRDMLEATNVEEYRGALRELRNLLRLRDDVIQSAKE